MVGITGGPEVIIVSEVLLAAGDSAAEVPEGKSLVDDGATETAGLALVELVSG